MRSAGLFLIGSSLMAAVLAGCAGAANATGPGPWGGIPPSAPTAPAAVDAELLARAADVERELAARGLLLDTAFDLTAYVDSVGRRLLAATGGSTASYRFHVLRDPAAGAFSLPNGGVYAFVGLLARVTDEAQLAWVLAHEIAHVERRHAAGGLRELRRKVAAAKLADLLFAGLAGPTIGHQLAASLGRYSREQEEEADRDAVGTIGRAGYRVEQAAVALDILDRERGPESDDALLYSSHPSIARRKEVVRSLFRPYGAAVDSGASDPLAYRPVARRAAKLSIELALGRRLYAAAIADAERELALVPGDSWFLAAVGEAHRLIAADPDGAAHEAAMRRGAPADAALLAAYRARESEERRRAAEMLRRALALDGENAFAHRGLGLLAHAEGDRISARRHLERYLQSAGPVTDRSLIQKILEEGNP